MLYREAGQFKTSYRADGAIFPIPQDRVGFGILLGVAFLVVPLVANDYWLGSILVPFLVYAMAAIGLNLLTGYCGQLSLGTGGFMACGAFAAYKLATAFPTMSIVVVLLLAGLVTAVVGLAFGIPSLRIKGFYLAVATLAAQFFLLWLFNKVGWFTNDSPSGVISAPPRTVAGWHVTGSGAAPVTKYLFLAAFVCVLALAAKNLTRSRIGRAWMAIRDMDIAAEIIGIRPLRTKLLAFGVSSFYIGISGALWAFVHTGSVEALSFDIHRSFQVLFMIIIGGLGSILGSFLGAGFVVLLPILLNRAPELLGVHVAMDVVSHLELVVFGVLIIVFLVLEPHGLARLWTLGKEKLRLWPFPH